MAKSNDGQLRPDPPSPGAAERSALAGAAVGGAFHFPVVASHLGYGDAALRSQARADMVLVVRLAKAQNVVEAVAVSRCAMVHSTIHW